LTEVLLFTAPKCPACMRAKLKIKELGLAGKIREIDASSVEGYTEMALHEIFGSAAPTMVVGKKTYRGAEVEPALVELAKTL